MRRDLVAAIHAGYWGLYLMLLTLGLFMVQFPHGAAHPVSVLRDAWPILLLAVTPNVLAFYMAYTTLFGRFLARKRFMALLLGGSGISVAAASVGLALALLLFGPSQPVFTSITEGTAVTASFIMLAAVHAAVALVMRGFVTWYADIHAREELAKKTHETELALIRSRLDPHFLFNTLNNIDVLIARDPKAASDFLNRLSDIMRFVLYQTKREAIALGDELAYIEKYIALESIRTRCAGAATLDVVGDPSGLSIAPMTLIPFIENAFKHSDGLRDAGAIASRVVIEGRRLTFECSNRCRAVPPAVDRAVDDGGVGNGLVRRRLQLLYPDRHVLEAGIYAGRYAVRLTIEA